MTARPVMAVVRPVQNEGQLPGRLSAASQVLRYGERTASGTAGGRRSPAPGEACAAPGEACAAPGEACATPSGASAPAAIPAAPT
ncbi:hypothetical protein Asp14428_77180 [Actinoplanes sp. NBRC 14428]|nr:hypothetical protein Asp14428_77180 [Actinoplanes sp. NBRC 14428]